MRPAWLCGCVDRVAAALCRAAGCRQDMHDQPKYKPLARVDVLRRRRSPRGRWSPGTVARGHLRRRHAALHGQGERRATSTTFPFPVDATRHGARPGAVQHLLLAVPRPHRAPATAWSSSAATASRRRFTTIGCAQAPVGHFFDVMTNGFGAMPDYAAQITPEDRWAIVAYVRALQLSQHATLADVPAADAARLNAAVTCLRRETADELIPRAGAPSAAVAARGRAPALCCRSSAGS